MAAFAPDLQRQTPDRAGSCCAVLKKQARGADVGVIRNRIVRLACGPGNLDLSNRNFAAGQNRKAGPKAQSLRVDSICTECSRIRYNPSLQHLHLKPPRVPPLRHYVSAQPSPNELLDRQRDHVRLLGEKSAWFFTAIP